DYIWCYKVLIKCKPFNKWHLLEIKYVEKSFVMELNKKIIDEWNARHPQLPEFANVSEVRLDEVLQIVEKVGNQLVTRDQIITKAAHLLGGLAWAQAFSGGNKRTAILSTTVFLRRNGLSITFPREEQRELRQFLFAIQEDREQLQQEIIDKLILYIRRNAK
ncbi:MAG: Fic family protein, partial [Thaumarchaeota archaeon]|nr:Fic family protein [Nitrososphaerota archaeon]